MRNKTFFLIIYWWWVSLIFLFVGLQFEFASEALNLVSLPSREQEHEMTPPDSTANPRNDNKEQSHISLYNNLSSGGLVIHVQSWAEGMSRWLQSLAALQVVAKKLNATLIEPEILNGRLVGDEKGHLRLFEFMDKATFDPDVSWIRLEEFHQERPESSAVTTIDMCFAKCGAKNLQRGLCDELNGPNACRLVGSKNRIPGDYRRKSSPRLQKALDLVAGGKLVLLKIHSFWNESFSNMQVMIPPQEKNGAPRRTLALHDRDQADRIRAQFDFQPHLYEKADIALQLFGIQQGQPFHAIHWRAERIAGMDYTECALRILDAREQMALGSSPSNVTKFLLLSSLSTNTTRTWNQWMMRTGADDAQNALEMLLLGKETTRFVKVDQVYHNLELRDPIDTVAIDLILAEKASHFATCTRSCNYVCKECNFIGAFALLAIGMRTKQTKESYACWPSKAKPAGVSSRASIS